MKGRPYALHKEGILLHVRLSPNASANRIDAVQDMGDADFRLKIKVTAVPEKGKANKALIKLLSSALHISRNNIEVVSGYTDRNKNILLRGYSDKMSIELDSLIAEIKSKN